MRAKVARLECLHAFALADPTALPILERSAAGEVNETLLVYWTHKLGVSETQDCHSRHPLSTCILFSRLNGQCFSQLRKRGRQLVAASKRPLSLVPFAAFWRVWLK